MSLAAVSSVGLSSLTMTSSAGPSSSAAVSSIGLSSLTMTSSAGPSSNSSRSATSRRVHEKKPVPYQTYDPKEALGLAGHEHKGQWLLLRVCVIRTLPYVF